MIESASPRPASILITAERRKSGFLPHRLITQMRERIGHHRVVPIKVPANGREYRKLTRILSLRQNLRAPRADAPRASRAAARNAQRRSWIGRATSAHCRHDQARNIVRRSTDRRPRRTASAMTPPAVRSCAVAGPSAASMHLAGSPASAALALPLAAAAATVPASPTSQLRPQ